MDEQITEEAPRRGRMSRQAEGAQQRRRRNAGSLNRMAQFALDFIEPEDLDLENYVYRWISDTRGRIHMLTQMDDYDFVRPEELGASFQAEKNRLIGESDDRIRTVVDTDKSGQPVYAYYCKKPRAFWEADNQEMVERREAMMESRVYRGEANADEETDDPTRYVPAGVRIGGATQRRRGPVSQSSK